ncbi:MAG: NADH-quinone oxidoreductase subunit J [Candidatus Thermoplasmatota archaeon]|nr:NADH-quinone oxidoreductase subunit J [Candidatus Thermoplasmatota archaeon]
MVEAVQLVFILVSAIEVVTSLLVVTAKKLMWAAIWLALTLITMAGIYILFQSEFVAIIQIIVYAGAVPVVFLFGIMLTRTRAMEEVP